MGDIVKGVPVTPAHLKLTLDDAAKDVINDFTTNGKRSIRVVERRINKYLLPYFRGRRMSDISASDVRAYVAKRQADTILVHKARVTGRTRTYHAASGGAQTGIERRDQSRTTDPQAMLFAGATGRQGAPATAHSDAA
jgi:hypothetical protein